MGKFAEVIGVLAVCIALGVGFYRMASAWAKGIDRKRLEEKLSRDVMSGKISPNDARRQLGIGEVSGYPSDRAVPKTERPARPRSQSSKGENI